MGVGESGSGVNIFGSRSVWEWMGAGVGFGVGGSGIGSGKDVFGCDGCVREWERVGILWEWEYWGSASLECHRHQHGRHVGVRRRESCAKKRCSSLLGAYSEQLWIN